MLPNPTSIPIELDPNYAPFTFDGESKPEGWGQNTKLFNFKSLLFYTEILQDNASLQAAIREWFRIRMPVDYSKTDLFVIFLNGEIFYRPSTKPHSGVELAVVQDVSGAGDFVELQINGTVFGFMHCD